MTKKHMVWCKCHDCIDENVYHGEGKLERYYFGEETELLKVGGNPIRRAVQHHLQNSRDGGAEHRKFDFYVNGVNVGDLEVTSVDEDWGVIFPG
jgi:hypothetical protein